MNDNASKASDKRFSRRDVRAFRDGMNAALERAQHVPEGYVAGFPESVGGTIKADPKDAK